MRLENIRKRGFEMVGPLWRANLCVILAYQSFVVLPNSAVARTYISVSDLYSDPNTDVRPIKSATRQRNAKPITRQGPMPLPVASDILRRLQNTIYQPWDDTHQPATLDSAHSAPSAISANPTLNTNTDTETDSSRNDLHNFNFGAHGAPTSPSPSSPPPQSSSPPFENLYPRPASELSNTRRRQPSTPAVSAPDVNAQSVLRKRILEIQSLSLPEREKARLIQVTPPSLF